MSFGPKVPHRPLYLLSTLRCQAGPPLRKIIEIEKAAGKASWVGETAIRARPGGNCRFAPVRHTQSSRAAAGQRLALRPPCSGREP